MLGRRLELRNEGTALVDLPTEAEVGRGSVFLPCSNLCLAHHLFSDGCIPGRMLYLCAGKTASSVGNFA